MVKPRKQRVWDLIERVGLTFVGAFIAVYLHAVIVSGSAFETFTNGELVDQAVTAGLAAIVPLVAGLVGFKIGDRNNASIVVLKDKDDCDNSDKHV